MADRLAGTHIAVSLLPYDDMRNRGPVTRREPGDRPWQAGDGA
jgi:hypothetical protein